MKAKNVITMLGELVIFNGDTGAELLRTHNVVVCAGCAFMAGYLSGGSMTTMSTVVPGSGATSPTTANSALEAEIGGVAADRHVAVIDAPTSTSVRFSASYGPGHATGNWYEMGIFNSTVAAGNMLSRVTFGLLTKGASDTFIVEYTISFADDGV